MDNGTKFFLFLHIGAAVLWVGGGITLHVIGRRALASGDRQRMLQFSQDADWIGPRFYAPLSIVLLLAGFKLVSDLNYDMSTTFVSIGLTGWLISFGIGIGYYSRAAKKRDEVVAAEGLDGPGFLASYKQVANVNAIEISILLFVVFAMSWKMGV